MPLKPRYKRRIMWAVISACGIFAFSFIVLPPMIHLNSLKNKIETAIYNQTGIKANIHGNINFSLLGKTTIIAHNITVPNGFISSFEFAVPLSNLFHLDTATISDNIIINGASLHIDKIIPFNMNYNIVVNDSKIKFLNKEYEIINGDFSKNSVNALIRTDQHKYEIKSFNNNFTIRNKNNKLNLSGQLLPDGTATAHIDIVAQDINKWFEFKQPKINGTFPVTADIKWDGGYGIDFYNISANGVTGNANLLPDGKRDITLQSKTADYNMSFAVKHPDIFKNTHFNLDFYGNIKFINNNFKHLYLDVIGTENNIIIKEIIADKLKLNDGVIDKDGAHDINVVLMVNNVPTKCLFNGTPNVWSCKNFVYDNIIFGDISYDNKYVYIDIYSDKSNPVLDTIVKTARMLADTGTIKFQFADIAGTIRFSKKSFSVQYDYAKNKTLQWANTELVFLPDFMLTEPGDFVWNDDTMIFTPKSNTWTLAQQKDYFYINGDNFKKWFPNTDLRSMNDLPYSISGNFKHGNISNLIINIAKQRFVGSASNKSITLKTDLLNLDSFASQEFLDNYEELSFFVNAPITIPFDLKTNISLSADTLIYQENRYNNFIYTLKPNVQTFSITDSNRGNILTTIKKHNSFYDINIQLNKFVLNHKILPNDMPLNVSDSAITAEINLKTSGIIAHDIFENINGVFDASFEGGTLYGLGLADFYASAPNITTLNAEYALSNALENGNTPIKKMRIIGIYDKGNIQTTKPISLSVKHADITGDIQINNNKMTAVLKMILRGTSSGPAPVDLIIYPDNKREYSLSEIMMSFDPEYMRTFIQSHNRF